MKNNNIDIYNIKQIPIRGYLASRGIHPTSEHITYGMYLSPYRQEKNPSFRVDYLKNLWYDFGTGQGGSIIDLVMAIEHCRCAEAIRLLNGQSQSATLSIASTSPQNNKPKPSPISITHVQEVEAIDLLSYANERCIDTTTLRRYCSEVHYRIGCTDYQAIGFHNDSGGWELRNRTRKISNSPKDISTIDRGSNRVAVFEGFFDFLSACMLNLGDQVDILVLNSVSNLQRATAYLLHHNAIYLFLDNDPAGYTATRQIVQTANSSRIYNYATCYKQFNDLNEYIINTQLCHTK